MNMRLYRPSLRYLALVPMVAGAILGMPLANPPYTYVWSALVMVGSYVAWRWFNTAVISETTIRGRDPNTLKQSELLIEQIIGIEEAEFGIGRIPGWIVFNAERSQVVFLPQTADEDPVVRVLRKV